MSEATAAKVAKAPREEKVVTMKDGRAVTFVGKRKLLKDYIIDESKVVISGDQICLKQGAVGVRLDYVNGETRLWTPPLELVARGLGHGLIQKLGDEIAGTDDVDDCVIATDDLMEQLDKGDWNQKAEGGGFSGASVVIRALVLAAERKGKPITVEKVKTYLNGRLEAAKAKNEKLSRKELYDSFRKPGTTVGDIVQELEKEKAQKASKVDANAEFDSIMAAA